MNRKAQDWNIQILGLVIITLVAVGLLLFVSWQIISMLQKKTPVEICRLSVLAAAESQAVMMGESLTNLDCHTQYYLVSEDGVYLDDEKLKNSYKNMNDPDLVDHTIKKALAQALYDCWFEFHEGTVIPFDQDFLSLSPDNHCVICSQIEFTETFSGAYPGPTTDIIKALNKTTISGKNVLEYIGDDRKFLWWHSTDYNTFQSINQIEHDKSYGIIFFLLTRDWIDRFIPSFSDADEEKAILMIVDLETLDDVGCDLMY